MSKDNMTKDGKPFWKSRNKTSDAFGLLFRIRLDTPMSRLSTDEVYNRHEIFKQYSIEDFKKYDNEIIELTAEKGSRMRKEINEWQLQRSVTVKKNVKSFKNSRAKRLLIEDTKSGKAGSMRPSELYKTRIEYQAFSLDDFRKYVYQIKYKQIAGPYWQKKRNQTALKEHLKSVDRMYEEYLVNNYEDTLEAITEGFQNLNGLSE